MKKYFGIALVVVTLGFLTGCGSSNTLKCTQTETYDEGTQTETIKVSFSKDSIAKLEMTSQIKVNNEYKDELEEYKEELAEEKEYYEEQAGYSFNYKVTGNTATYTITADFAKLDDEEKESILEYMGSDYDSVKKAYEAQGYKCK